MTPTPGAGPAGRPRLVAVTDRPLPASDAGTAALDTAAAFIARYVALPSAEALTALTLWAAHTWAVTAWYTTPRLVLDSAEPGSGKTRTLEVLALLCHRPELLFSATPAAIFRMLDQPLTLLFDEVDAIFGAKTSGNGTTEDLRALLNAGYKRGATIPRCVGDGTKMRVVRFPVFAPVALAGLAGNMPDTITTRAILIHLKRRSPDEHLHPFRQRDAEHAAEPIRDQLATWATAVTPDLTDARPELPTGVTDRPAEVWEPLVAIADAAGHHWPNLARDACTAFALNPEHRGSLGIRLLADLHDLFTTRHTDRIATTDILAHLTALDEAPWADLWGKPLDSRRLARELARYGVRSHDGRTPTGTVLKGYRTDGADGLADAWRRYLPPTPATTATTATTQANAVAPPDQQTLQALQTPPSPQDHVADVAAPAHPSATHLTSAVAAVAPVAPTPPHTRCIRCHQPLTYDDGTHTHQSCA
ncbi:MAG TPA: DUF3631 domain-containing protein [Mycobacteriales bacterium]|nr:DUF3631 domain-containing protein [Mycobacteriales bacterium]